ncbi:hypothetical protein KFE25_012109 [Diacronema lutheri]|uniref:Methyltransferase domain-containing protein n=1 Tax=Diacronema lutheri TaxID=2081491 RepID=A0A8J5XKM0_DIALT|nr:hypothetical protein KFE25_012109 [Diacronema lutheri]
MAARCRCKPLAFLSLVCSRPVRPIVLPPRLEPVRRFILDASPASSPLRVADVGCDHGALAIALCAARSSVECAHAARVIGIDIAEAALAGARANARASIGACSASGVFHSAGSSVEFRLGDGLGALRAQSAHDVGGEADVLTVSGVGVRTTFAILRHDDAGDACGRALRLRGVRHLVLQPGPNPRPTAMRALRAFVHGAGFDLVADTCELIGGRHYVTLACARAEDVTRRSERQLQPPREAALLGGARQWPVDVARGYAQHHARWLRTDLRHMAEWRERRWGERVGICDADDERAHAQHLDGRAPSTRFVEYVAPSDLRALEAFVSESAGK